MPATVNVNILTVVHASSSGMAMSFPDVCKTPTPAGPVPIPYPNIAQSSDTADGSSTVKVDGNPIMLKSSNFKMSTGDEAGSAMGVVSNKIKGKAIPVNASFDVKVDGKNVFRLTDPMQTNCGSNGNSMDPAEVQAPLPEGTFMSEECQKVKKKRHDQTYKENAKRSGMLKKHFDKIRTIAEEMKMVFYFRGTESVCEDWITKSHQPKPHKIFKGNTIKAKAMDDGRPMLDWVQDWLNECKTADASVRKGQLLASNARYAAKAAEFLGVIGGLTCGPGKAEPLKVVTGGIRDSGISYGDKWITADYDLYQILRGVAGCEEVNQKSRAFTRIRVAINQSLKWDAIQHGPQAQWVANEEDVKLGATPGTNFPAAMKQGFKNNDPKQEAPMGQRKAMKVFDKGVTIIAPGGTLHLETDQDTFDALKCRECDK